MYNHFVKSDLIEMLRYRRPAGSYSEQAFVDRFIIDYLERHDRVYVEDAYGNIKVDVGNPTTLFSCHTDTCEQEPGMRPEVLEFEGEIYTFDEILGADDGAGVLVLLHMIENEVPGRYVFHRAEEIGMRGARFSVANNNWHEGIRLAVAFDRRGTHDVVIVQMGIQMLDGVRAGRMIDALGRYEGKKFHTAIGSYTDVAVYFDKIGSCMNISVGYDNEHTDQETLNLDYLDWLMGRVIDIDWDFISGARKPQTLGEAYALWDARDRR